mgnify:CR=1 FL=1
MKNLDFSVIIPVYNGEQTVAELYARVEDYFNSASKAFEVIFVYDHGKDNSWPVLLEIKRDNAAKVRLVKLSRNYGQHNAIIAGIERAHGQFIVTMDEDLQHNPNDIARLIEEQQKGDFDVVYGAYDERKHSGIRNFGSSVLKSLISIGIPDIHKDYSAFRLLKRHVAKNLVEMQNSYTFLDGYISWITTNCSSCTVSHAERQGGKSAYDFKKLVNHTINIFVTFSDLPLKTLTFSSIFIFIITAGFSLYVLLRKLILDNYETGYASLIIAIGFGVSVVMLSLGVVGEYIHRINLKTTRKPNYIIKEEH